MPTVLRQDPVSKFVVSSIKQIDLASGAQVLDIPCGFGRHARWLASNGCVVIGLDIDERRILKARVRSAGEHIQWGVADAERSLPVRDGSFDIVIIVHYVSCHLIEMARRALKSRGHLIFETFDARGENWRDLPHLGAVPDALKHGFETVYLHERPVGPEGSRAVVRALARSAC